jgi:hypothetical protein
VTSRHERERRRAPRAWVSATAILRDERDDCFYYAVDNLSVIGAFLSGGPLLPLGATVTMLVTLETDSPVLIVAKVVRHRSLSGDGPALGVVFLSMSAHARSLIRRAVLEAGQPARKLVGAR